MVKKNHFFLTIINSSKIDEFTLFLFQTEAPERERYIYKKREGIRSLWRGGVKLERQ